jgi:hypothetical protein
VLFDNNFGGTKKFEAEQQKKEKRAFCSKFVKRFLVLRFLVFYFFTLAFLGFWGANTDSDPAAPQRAGEPAALVLYCKMMTITT